MATVWAEIAAKAGIIGFIGFMFEYLENSVKPEIRIKFSNWLSSYSLVKLGDSIRSCNGLFIGLFDNIFKGSNSRIKNDLWAVINISIIFIIFQYIVVNIRVDHYVPLPLALRNGIVFGLLMFFPIFIAYLVVVAILRRLSDWYFSIVKFHASRYAEAKLGVEVFNKGSYKETYKHEKRLLSILMVISYVIKFVLVPVIVYPSFIFFRLSLKLADIVSPIRVFISSLIGIILILAINMGEIEKFIIDYNKLGFLAIFFVIINVIADSYSMVETRFVLGLASKVRFCLIPILLLLDLFASALIFMVIPLLSGNFAVFLSAIFFKGEMSWLGILFWSTFFTSFVFYLFLVSSFGLIILNSFMRGLHFMGKVIDVSEKPFRCLGLVMMFIVGVVFAVECLVFN